MEYTHAATYYVQNFKAFILICDEYCDHCDLSSSICLTCKTNFVLEKDKCVCKLVLQGGVCQPAPLGTYHFYIKDFQPYTSKTQVFSDSTGLSYEFFADYNTTQRSRQISIDGNNAGGSFIQNEYIQYPINQVISTPTDFTVEFILYMLGPIGMFSNIQILVDSYIIGQVTNFGDLNNIMFNHGQLYNKQTCSVVGYSSCYKYNAVINLFQIDHLNTIQFKGHFNVTDSKQAWAFSDLKISKIVWQPSICTDVFYYNECIKTCPSYAPLFGVNQCKDLLEIYKFSEYVVKLFFNYGSVFFDENALLFKSKLTSNTLQVYNSKFMFGGYQAWQTDQFSITLVCNPHYKARLFVKLVLIDFGSNNDNNMTVYFDQTYKVYNWQNAVAVASTEEKGDQLVQDYTVTISGTDFEVNHDDRELLVSFNCNAFNTAYCGLYDFFVIVALCPINCLRCSDSSTCLEIKSDKFVLTVYYDCPQGYYQQAGSCIQCLNGCKVCVDQQSCNQCFDTYIYYDKQCFCQINGLSSGDCSSDCHPLCETCANFRKNNNLQCLTCDTNQGKVMNIQSCECQEGFYLTKNFSCERCHDICKNCLLSARFCIQCNSLQNRELEFQDCICKEGYFEVSDSYTCMKCSDRCKTCEFFETYCTSCYVSQMRTLKENDCVCSLGHYQYQQNLICSACNDLCEYCSDYNVCTSCYDVQFRILSVDKCICQSGYYQNSNQLICSQCYYTCSECNGSNEFNQCTKCPKTRIRSNVYLNVFECDCKVGYYDNNELECIDCSTYKYPPITHYCYSKCGDQIIQWNEQCDDGNLEPRDGCNQCYLSNNKCLTDICLKCHLGDCQQCVDGYYLENDFTCQLCSPHCVTCLSSPTQCVECKFYTPEKECITCISSAGYTIIDNQCISLCGDGIRTTEELCDDGNTENGDGCSSFCTVEDGYICDQICVKIDYVDIILTESPFDKIYDSSRSITLTFDQVVNITQAPLKDSISMITKIPNYKFTAKEITDRTQYTKEFNQVDIQIVIQLSESIESPEIIFIVSKNTEVISKDHFSFQSRNQSFTLLQYQALSESEISNTQNLVRFNSYILYLLIGFAILAFLFGGLDIFWNLLDTLQVLSYLKYLNVLYPYNLETYFQLFGFAEFDFLKSNFSVEDLISSSIEIEDPALKFKEEGYTSLFFANVIAIFIVIMTTIGTYIFFHIVFYCIYHYAKKVSSHQLIANYQQQEEPNVIIFLCLKLTRTMQKYFYNLKIQYKTGILRAFLTISYDLNLAIFLQLMSYSNSSSILILSSLFALVLMFCEMYFIYFGVIVMSNKRFYFELQEVQLKYGALYEGIELDSNPYSLYYNIVLFTKKLLFMFFLVFLYDYPLFQIGFVSSLNAIFFTYIIYNKPLIDKSEYYKQITTEVLLWITELLILLMGFGQKSEFLGYQSFIEIGWVIITILTLLIFIQLIIDIRQHMIFLIENYEILRILVNKMKQLHQSLFSKEIHINNDESQSLVGSSSRGRLKQSSSKLPSNQSSQKQVRKLITFKMNDSIL
ncbi:unnamed protein product (macronuclear) [Paramecium tetraurelia]|uniref:TNFR-Cys domain-containing protein n=1 Tax=Paramecium tetraurelia TaxID=5888 RepID=A0D4N3_PARTE|nr:uncharacterized protein GSPATT00013447001 [Paramecium tetraurelia]CAK78000.1 unnamed protein product [Paramecium tetraurelia]|eukprot:XP_001445397.1 hypothetical protein (macronuclear) [Paramecium tetraurelia strain d4-2]